MSYSIKYLHPSWWQSFCSKALTVKDWSTSNSKNPYRGYESCKKKRQRHCIFVYYVDFKGWLPPNHTPHYSNWKYHMMMFLVLFLYVHNRYFSLPLPPSPQPPPPPFPKSTSTFFGGLPISLTNPSNYYFIFLWFLFLILYISKCEKISSIHYKTRSNRVLSNRPFLKMWIS